ncbi:D-aminoacyl-tRNA deacylase [Desulfosoma sp.]
MRAVVQRVSKASVDVDGQTVAAVGRGLVVLVGVGRGDTEEDARYLAEKVVHLRIFPDEDDKLNRSVLDIGGAVLAVSQFTLWGDCRKGRRPSFVDAAPSDQARCLYEAFLQALRDHGVPVETGVFKETMAVHLTNDGPVTILLDSRKAF